MVSAFAIILAAVFLIYLAGALAAPKSRRSGEARSPYACGEKATVKGTRLNVSIYRFILYFAVLDASVLLLAFAALYGFTAAIMPYMLVYLFLISAAALILSEGGGL